MDRADWSDVLAEFAGARTFAETPKTEGSGYRRHKDAGKLWFRERIELLLDPDSFRELGSTAGSAAWTKVNAQSKNPMEAERQAVPDFTPSDNVQDRCKFPTISMTL
ncbi:uncharacterized protein Z519_01852 [Cladophialophora bantiana CBS 173.52]|uniref:Acetyl-CoA carboxylase domain-containing protein n=1 Tax=Cladophialophora bantiana (strain ATCC 10958 / CBS 173.52 / CDC B-1940 / NIH 8579) TaxID=1442370 RepID=A0A0D2HXW8_CLAB1|nr:uncharacterized protein Z519_01852 [Cladophialophora bantiana CBS 173.52]KIW98268.1 hypothetical protein Z519_01852 [Cladophialophora bantiana CBS 173.52]